MLTFQPVQGTQDIFIAVNDTEKPLVSNAQDALDLIATARYERGDCKLVLNKTDIAEPFYDLSTRIAGEVLQKFINYSMKVAIVGDYSAYTSKSLRDFIYESNNGQAIFFVPDMETAVEKLDG